MKISQIKKRALESLKGKWGLAVLLSIIMFVVTTILPTIVEIFMVGGFMVWIDLETTPISVDIFYLVYAFAVIPFNVAVSWYFLENYRYESPELSRIYTVYKDGAMSLKLIGTSFVMGVFVMLWSLLLIIPGIIKGLAYSQALYILKDNPDYGILEAITESRKKMNGYKWKYFLLLLSFIGWAILCLFTLGIGFLWLVPYVTASLMAFYHEVVYLNEEV